MRKLPIGIWILVAAAAGAAMVACDDAGLPTASDDLLVEAGEPSVQTIGAEIAALIDAVEALVEEGALKKAFSNRLVVELEKASRRFEEADPTKGCRELDKFVTEVAKLIDQGKLESEDGEPLIDQANDIITASCE